MTESEKRLRRCAFTGHRPEKLNFAETEIRELLRRGIEKAYTDGFNVFISGVASGVDLWAADIVLCMKAEHPDIKLICAIPFEGYDLRWSNAQRLECQRIMKNADFIVTVCKQYTNNCFQRRNEWIVNHSSRLLAVWNGKPSGTGNTVRYARSQGIEVINLLDNYS